MKASLEGRILGFCNIWLGVDRAIGYIGSSVSDRLFYDQCIA